MLAKQSDIDLYTSQDRRQYDLKRLCEKCLLTVAQKTLELQPVIMILHKVGKDFTSCLCNKIITSNDRQAIHKATTDAEALFFIRDVCFCICNGCH